MLCVGLLLEEVPASEGAGVVARGKCREGGCSDQSAWSRSESRSVYLMQQTDVVVMVFPIARIFSSAASELTVFQVVGRR